MLFGYLEMIENFEDSFLQFVHVGIASSLSYATWVRSYQKDLSVIIDTRRD